MAFIKKNCNVAIAVFTVAVLITTIIAAVQDPIPTDDLPAPNYGQIPTDDLKKEARDAILQAEQAKTLEDAATHYSAFIQKYPLSPDIMQRLAAVYIRMDRLDDARQMLKKAATIAEDDRIINLIDVHLARIDILEGKLDTAETLLRQIMKRATPDKGDQCTNPFNAAPQLLEARYHLARVLNLKSQQFKDNGKDIEADAASKEADSLLKGMGDDALTLLEYWPDTEWAKSYAALACRLRMRYVLAADPQDAEKADALASQLHERLRSIYPSATFPIAVPLTLVGASCGKEHGSDKVTLCEGKHICDGGVTITGLTTEVIPPVYSFLDYLSPLATTADCPTTTPTTTNSTTTTATSTTTSTTTTTTPNSTVTTETSSHSTSSSGSTSDPTTTVTSNGQGI